MARKKIALSEEQEKLAADCTKLQRDTVINIECYGMSQAKAYTKAGGKAKGKAIDSTVSRMLTFDKVKAFRSTFHKETLTKAIMTREEALERLTLHARIKITDICTFSYVEFTDDEGNEYINTVWEMKDAKDIDPDIAACIKSVTFTKTGPKIELYDANGSIKILSDMQGWNAPKEHKHSGEFSVKHEDMTDEELEARILELERKFSNNG